MSLVLSDSVTAVLQSSMRRWMTVLTTCIWIGFKVSYACLKVFGLVGPACIMVILYIYSSSSSHGLWQPLSCCNSPFLCGLSPALFLSLSRFSLYTSISDLISNSKGGVLQSCKIVVYSPWW